MNSTEVEAKWIVLYFGHPTPTLTWYDFLSNPIQLSLGEDKNRKFDAIHDKRTTTIKIRNPKISDSGNYTIKWEKDRREKVPITC